MISIEMSPAKFGEAKKVLATTFEGQKQDSLTETGEFTGHVHTKQLDADYEYRQRTNTEGTLVFLNEVKHGLYGMVSDDTMGSHLVAMLKDVPEPSPQTVSEPNPAGELTEEEKAELAAKNVQV